MPGLRKRARGVPGIPKPRSDFFVVYNELDSDDPRFVRVNRSIAVKMNYSLTL